MKRELKVSPRQQRQAILGVADNFPMKRELKGRAGPAQGGWTHPPFQFPRLGSPVIIRFPPIPSLGRHVSDRDPPACTVAPMDIGTSCERSRSRRRTDGALWLQLWRAQVVDEGVAILPGEMAAPCIVRTPIHE